MKLSYISNQVIPSKSAESIFVAKSCSSLISSGYDVLLLCPMRRNFYINTSVAENYSIDNIPEIKYFPFPSVKGKYIIYHFFIFLSLLINRPNISYSRTVIGAFVSYILKIDTILELHSLPRKFSLDGWLFYFLSKKRRLKLLVCISNALKKDLIDVFKVSETIIHVEHDATDIKKPINYEAATNVNFLNLGYVGSLYPGKGMEIISKLSHLLINKDIIITVYGGSSSEIQSWATQCASNVKFMGYTSYANIYDVVSTFDVCLLPNQPSVQCAGHKNGTTDIGKYTSPMKMFDYMAAKKPIISSDLPILREVLDETTAYFAKYDDPQDWLNKVNEIISNNYLAKDKANFAYNKIVNFYNWDFRVKRIMARF